MMRAYVVLALLAVASTASAQNVDIDAITSVLSGYTDGSKGVPSDSYLTTMATTLASGFISSIGQVLDNATDFVQHPEDYQTLLDGLEDQFCDEAKLEKSKKKPAIVMGPEILLQFQGGACLLNETHLLDFKNGTGNSALSVDCLTPSVTVDILPAKLTSPYKTGAKFTDKECALKKEFGEETDTVVFVLNGGVFDIQGLVETVQTKLVSVLGEFSSQAGAVVSSPTVAPILQTVNAATALLG